MPLHIIEQKIKAGLVPQVSGIYKMLSKDGKVLYVGKAKNLVNRLKSYLQYYDGDGKGQKEFFLHSQKTKRLISIVKDIEIITTASESEALILEASLIKALFPPYNIMLKDDKSMPYLAITKDHNYPLIYQHRGKKIAKNSYFGPYANSLIVQETIDMVQKFFQLRTCSDSEFKMRKRPCLKYQIKLCSAPCMNFISKQDYEIQVAKAQNFLNGKNKDFKNELTAEMKKASESEEFERAIFIRNKLDLLTKIQQKGDINFVDFVDSDVVSVLKDQDTFAVQVFFLRNGYNFGSKVFFPRSFEDSTEDDVLEAFLMQFYQENHLPQEILINMSIKNQDEIAKALKVKLLTPKAGKKLDLVSFCIPNITFELQKYNFSRNKNMQNLILLKDFLSLDEIPKRIDVFDNSHTQGADFIGAMIVATPDGFNKKEYRKYNVKFAQTKAGDDFAMMYEVMMRRYGKMTPENRPDLIVIDGGKGQMTSVMRAFNELNLNIPFVCISKGVDRNAGNELFHTPKWQDRPLEKNSPLMFYMQNIRDEAHRFAINTHRAKRAKSFIPSFKK